MSQNSAPQLNRSKAIVPIDNNTFSKPATENATLDLLAVIVIPSNILQDHLRPVESPLPNFLRRGREDGYPLPPAQIPACGFLAPGPPDNLASTPPPDFPLSMACNSTCIFVQAIDSLEGYSCPSASPLVSTPNDIELSRCDRRRAKRKRSPPKGAVGWSE